MRKYLVCMAGIFILLAATVLVARTAVDFSGTWKLDVSKSDRPMMGRGPRGGMMGGGGGFPGGGRRGGRGPMGNETLTIQQNAANLTLTRTMGSGDQARSFQQTFDLTGAQSTNPGPMGRGQITSTAAWKDNVLAIQNTETMTGPDGNSREMKSQEEFSLSEDGQTLTIKTTRSTPRGEMSFKQVFARQ